MREDSWILARSAVDRWRREQFEGQTAATDHWVRVAYERFPALLDFVETSARHSLSSSYGERGLAVAVLAFGPADGGPSPERVWKHLRKIAAGVYGDHAPDAASLADIVIAWACGWGRRTSGMQADPWERTWEGAFLLLRHLVHASITWTLQRLDGRPLPKIDEDSVVMWTDLISLEYARGSCRCGRHIQTCRVGGDGERTCGRTCCRGDHRLSDWRPNRVRLRAAVAQAVRGSAGRALQPGAFQVSKLFPLLAQDYGLHVGAAEFRICHACNGDHIRNSLRSGEAPTLAGLDEGLFDGQACPKCDTPVDPKLTYVHPRNNWMVVPREWQGPYVFVARLRCPACGNLYEPSLDVCPLTYPEHTTVRKHPQRESHVWSRVPPRATILDDEDTESDPDLVRGLDVLPEPYRRMLTLKYWNDLDEMEIADAIGQSVESVRASLRAAHVMLRESMAAEPRDALEEQS